MRRFVFIAAVIAAMVAGLSEPAMAQFARTFVSGHGSDANPCNPLTLPCRSLSVALAQTNPGGEITILDPAGYGAATITKSVSIINDGIGEASLTASSGDAVTINAAATDKIVLRGLTVIGLGTGSNGIVFNTGGSLSVEDCKISQFTFDGILFQPTNSSRLYVSNTRVFNNATGGIYVHPLIPSASGTVAATFERLEARDDTQAGVFVDGRQSGQSLKLYATIADSVLADSASQGVVSITGGSAAPTFVMVRNTTITNNAIGGRVEGTGATAGFAHSTLSGNTTAFSQSGGSLLSYGDNNVDGNGTLGATPAAVAFH